MIDGPLPGQYEGVKYDRGWMSITKAEKLKIVMLLFLRREEAAMMFALSDGRCSKHVPQVCTSSPPPQEALDLIRQRNSGAEVGCPKKFLAYHD
mmetsp:Transcript_143936/g.203654  ORF Transcript_143936/g.203654 Transcript_143936/m.203654 type:complete len:94 (-) Transcript_143936:114-395(-)